MPSIGVDFGGTRIKVASVKEDQILAEAIIDTPQGQGPEAVLDALARAVTSLDPSPEALGLAIPGEVDRNGACYRLPNVPGFEGFRVAEYLEPRLSCKVNLENDGNAAALWGHTAIFGTDASATSISTTIGTGHRSGPE